MPNWNNKCAKTDSQIREAVTSCEEHKCKAADRRILLQVLWFVGFVQVSVSTILFWVGGEDGKTSSSH